MEFEEREEIIRVLPYETETTISRKSHFLNPIHNLDETLISDNLFSNSAVVENSKDVPFMIIMKGGCPQKNWNDWVKKMVPLHQHTWKKAGILEAILGSTYKIKKDRDLVIELAKRWSFETNTFVFPWGEATITLEDSRVLGNYSVLGKPVFTPLSKDDLELYYRIRASCPCYTGSYYQWMEYFMCKGCELEHLTFLILWLSRYVFPVRPNIIVKNVFSVAVFLSKGVEIALAPAVLCNIYNELSVLKRLLLSFSHENGCGYEKNKVKVGLSSPLQFVGVWGWERFPDLSHKPRLLRYGEPRLARWDKSGKSEVENIGEVIDCSGNNFQWKPYVVSLENGECGKWYKANETYVLVDSDMEIDVEEFGRFVRVSELVGFNCIEHYAPHRVGMQFGFDQDIPGCVSRQNETQQMAWSYYNRPIANSSVYMPPKLFEAGVSTRYFKWWNQARLGAVKSKILLEMYRVKEEPNHELGKQNLLSSYDIIAIGDKVIIDVISSDEEDELSLSNFLGLRKKQKVYKHKAFGETPMQCLTRSDPSSPGLKCDAEKLGTLVEYQPGCEIQLEEGETSTEEGNGSLEPGMGRIKDTERGVINYDGEGLTANEIISRLRNLEKLVRDLQVKISPDNLTRSDE